MKKIFYIILLEFIPFIANCASIQHTYTPSEKSLKKNEYYPVFLYSKDNKRGYIGLGLRPNVNGLGGMVVFSSLAYKDSKKLFETYQTYYEKLIYAPRKNVRITLNHQRFADISVSRNVHLVRLGFPYISSKIKFIETIASRYNDLSITLDKKIKFSTKKDARKDRLAWLDKDMFIKQDKDYPDQVQLNAEEFDMEQLRINSGCLSSIEKGRINNIKIFMTEIGEKAKIKNLKIIDLTFSDPVFHTSFFSDIYIKLKKNQIIPKFIQHEFKLVCTTTKGKQLNTQYTFTMKPIFNNEEPYR